MSKPNRKHKENCQNYLKSGRKAVNKAATAERQKKREEKIRQRREDGKVYTYQPNPYEKDTIAYEHEKNRRAFKYEESRRNQMGEYQRWARYYGRLNRFLDILKEAERQEEIKQKKSKKEKEDDV